MRPVAPATATLLTRVERGGVVGSSVDDAGDENSDEVCRYNGDVGV